MLPLGTSTLLNVTGVDRDNAGTTTRFLLPYEPVERLRRRPAPRVVRPRRWRHVVAASLAAATPSLLSLRAAARASLQVLPFQLEPVLALLAGQGCRLLIADEVGLGKTIQAGYVIAEVLAREHDARVLIVCPAGLRGQWAAELRDRFAIDASVFDAAGVARQISGYTWRVNPWSTERVIVASVDYVKRPEVIRALEPLVWDVVVFDEAHGLTGDSRRADAATGLAARARRLVMLTATPHSGDTTSFERLCAIGRLGATDSVLMFRRKRADIGLQRPRRETLLRVKPSTTEANMHTALSAYARRVWARGSIAAGGRLVLTVLMRRACSSPASLLRSLDRRMALLGTSGGHDPATQQNLPLGLGDDECGLDPLLAVAGLPDTADELDTLRRLRELTALAAREETKVDALRRLLRRVDEPLLLFTEYRDTLVHLTDVLGLPVGTLHGAMTPRERTVAANAFTSGSVRVLVATDAASEGLNLHARCRLVVNLELPWTPHRLEQRIGRVDRLGQTKPVHAIHLVARHTGEETILARLLARRDRARVTLAAIADAVVQGGPVVCETSPSHPPSLAIPADLRGHAQAEATWLRTAKQLATLGGTTSARPVVTTLAQPKERGRSRLWVWRVALVDDNGLQAWEGLVAISMRGALSTTTPASVRELLSQAGPEAIRLLRSGCRAVLATARQSAGVPVGALREREQAIAGRLRATGACVAAQLVQRGLFEHRAERRNLAETERLASTLRRCEDRLRQLDAAERLRVRDVSLLFGAVWR